jgi:hypothetical protein
VPLPHLLSAGISLVLTTAIAFAGTTAFLFALRRLEDLLKSKRINRRLKARARAIKTMKITIAYQAEVAKEEADRILSLRRRIAEYPKIQEVPAPKTDAERNALMAFKAQGEALLEEAKKHEADRAAIVERLSAMQRRNKKLLFRVRVGHRGYRLIVPTVRYGPLVLSVVVALFIPYPIGCALVLASLIWLISTKVKVPTRALRLSLYCIVAVGVVINGILWAPALPVASLKLRSETVEGTAIVVTDTTWYITPGHGIIRAIPASEVERGSTRLGRFSRQDNPPVHKITLIRSYLHPALAPRPI